MRLQTFVVFVFAAVVMEFMMGINTPMANVYAFTQVVSSPSDFLGFVISNAISITAISLLVGATIALSVFTGFSAVFIIPLLILMVVVNWFVFPVEMFGPACSAIVEAGTACPNPTYFMPIILFLNILAILTYIEFVRGPS